MTGTDEAEWVDEGGTGTGTDDGVVVDWDVRLDPRLRSIGLSKAVPGTVDVVVVDRRGCETTPCRPGRLSVGDHRILVVPDRRDGASPVEMWVAGTPKRYGGVVRTLRKIVALDASVDAAFESASSTRETSESGVSTDGGSRECLRGSMVTSLDIADTALAVGGFAGAVEPLE